MTFEEFLRFDERQRRRHEFVDGFAYALAGATTGHNLIAGNIQFALRLAAGGGVCRIYQEGVKLRVRDDVYYPDVMVVGAPGGDDERMAYAPCLLVEVLSPSTARNDRSQKLNAYRAIASLQSYLVVSRAARHVTWHWRDPAGEWQREELFGEGEIPLPCPAPGGVLTLDAIYRGIDFPTPPTGRPKRVKEERVPAGAAPGDAD
jgi:Uma2 family endonuclease